MRGLNSPIKKHIHKFLKLEQRIGILLLQEIKMKSNAFQKTVKLFWPIAKFFVSDIEGASGSFTTLWNPTSFNGTLINSSKNSIINRMQNSQYREWWNLINIYAANARSLRASIWNSLASHIMNMVADMWILGGKFISPLFPFEKSSRSEDFSKSMNDLFEFIMIDALMDISLQGSQYTWSNRRQGTI